MRTVPVLVALALTVNELDAPFGNDAFLHKMSLPKIVAPGPGDSAVNDGGSKMAVWTLVAVAGPWLVTTTVHVTVVFTFAPDGQERVTERSARAATT